MKPLISRKRGYQIVLLASCQLATIGATTQAAEPGPRTFNTPLLSDAQDGGANAIAETTSADCLTPDQLRAVVPTIQAVNLDVLRGPGQPPQSCFAVQQLGDEALNGNCPRWAGQNDYQWKASGLFSNPLYFEDVSLERNGQVSCVQNAVSGAKFFSTVAILPYKIGVDLPRERVYTLGHIRPGNEAPAVCEHLPFSVRGLAFQAGAVTGVGFLFP
jgi:hypothetical protein